jgi:hypothetical protein
VTRDTRALTFAMTFPHGDHEVLVVVTRLWISMIGPYQQALTACETGVAP